jgi:hypothetical protein
VGSPGFGGIGSLEQEEHDVWRVSAYHVITLKDAHDLHFAAKKLLATGVNPMAARKAEAEAKQQVAKAIQREVDSSFEKIAQRWWGMVVDRQVATSYGYPYGGPGTNVFPVIGWMSIDAAQTAHIRDVMLTIETRGAGDVAKRAHQSGRFSALQSRAK